MPTAQRVLQTIRFREHKIWKNLPHDTKRAARHEATGHEPTGHEPTGHEPPPDSEILTLDEVARYLKPGGTWRFRRSEPDRWIAAQIAGQTQNKP